MRQEIKYECKKYIFTKKNIVVMVLLIIAMLVILVFNEGGYLFEKSVRRTFFSQMKQEFSSADKQQIQEEMDQIQQELYDDTEEGLELNKAKAEEIGKYGVSKLDEYGFLRAVLQCIEKTEKRNRNMAVIKENNLDNMEDYVKEDNRMIVDDLKLTAAVNNMSYGWVPCLGVILFLCSSYALEYENKVNSLIEITKRGRGAIVAAKIMTGVFTAVIVNVMFWIVYLFMQWGILGMTPADWKMPLFLADGCQMCTSRLTILDFLLKQMLVSILVSVLAALFTIVVSRVIKRGSYTLFVSVILFVITMLPDILNTAIYNNVFLKDKTDWYLMSTPAFYKLLDMEKRINPVSMLHFEYFVQKPGYVQIAGAYYKAEVFPMLVALMGIALLVVILLYEKRRRVR